MLDDSDAVRLPQSGRTAAGAKRAFQSLFIEARSPRAGIVEAAHPLVSEVTRSMIHLPQACRGGPLPKAAERRLWPAPQADRAVRAEPVASGASNRQAAARRAPAIVGGAEVSSGHLRRSPAQAAMRDQRADSLRQQGDRAAQSTIRCSWSVRPGRDPLRRLQQVAWRFNLPGRHDAGPHLRAWARFTPVGSDPCSIASVRPR